MTPRAVTILFVVLTLQAAAQEWRRSAEQLYKDSNEAIAKGNLAEALDLLSKAITENAAYVDAYSLRASVRERLNDNQGALLDYNLSLELMPDQFEVLLSRAALRYQLGQYVLAREDFNKLLILPRGETNTIYYRRSAHSPGTDQMLTAQGAIQSQLFNYLGLIELELNNCSRAIMYFDSALYVNNLEADYYVNRALARQDCNQQMESVNDFRKALSINPDHPIARHNLAVTAARQGSYELADQQLTETIRLDSMMLDPYLERGYYRMLKSDYKGALQDYNRAVELEQNDPEIFLNRGSVREKLNDWKGAYADYSRAIDLKPDFTKAWLNRGNLLVGQLQYDAAIEDYTVALTYQPDYAAAFFNRAIASYRAGNKSNACSDVNKARQLGFKVEEKMVKQLCAGMAEEN
jgi:tetratricopeptide (TPR) repeat protein